MNTNYKISILRKLQLYLTALVIVLPFYCRTANSTDSPTLASALIDNETIKWSRINHLHSDSLQGKAQDSLNAIKQYTTQGTGMTAVLLSDLAAEFNLSTNVDNLNAKVAEARMASAMWTNSWLQLATNYYSDVGIKLPAYSTGNLALCAQIHTGQIFLRLSLLKTLMQTFKALMIGQQIQARQTTNSIAALSKQLANLSTNDVVATNDVISLGAVQNLVSGLIGASKDISGLVADADTQMRSFYVEAAQSEDPAALVELVPMVGAGLDTNSLAMLLDQTTAIRARLVEAYINTFCTTNLTSQITNDFLMRQFWQASWDCISNLYPGFECSYTNTCPPDAGVSSTTTHSRTKLFRTGQPNYKFSPFDYMLSQDEFQALTNEQSYHAYRKRDKEREQRKESMRAEHEHRIRGEQESAMRAEVSNSIMAEIDGRIEDEMTNRFKSKGANLTKAQFWSLSESQDFQVNARKPFLLSVPSEINSKINDEVSALAERQIQGSLTTENDVELQTLRSSFNIAAASQSPMIASNKIDLQLLLKSLSDLSSDTQDYALSVSSSLQSTFANGGSLISQLGRATNGLGGSLGISNVLFSTKIWGIELSNVLSGPLIGTNYINAQDQGKILKIFGDVISDREKQQSRVLSFLISLTSSRGDLRLENLRHYQALSVVVGKEVRRWSGLVWLHDKYSQAFDGGQLTFGGTIVPPLPDDLAGDYKLQPTDPNEPFRQISPNARILPSIRLLAESANYYHMKLPSTDQSGWLTINADQKLNQAIKLVQGYFLLDVFNRRYALESHSFLAKEMREHEIHVNGIVDQSEESEINLILSDQLAFHSTGWTPQDTQLVVNTLQSGLLAWIGYKQ